MPRAGRKLPVARVMPGAPARFARALVFVSSVAGLAASLQRLNPSPHHPFDAPLRSPPLRGCRFAPVHLAPLDCASRSLRCDCRRSSRPLSGLRPSAHRKYVRDILEENPPNPSDGNGSVAGRGGAVGRRKDVFQST